MKAKYELLKIIQEIRKGLLKPITPVVNDKKKEKEKEKVK
jgi:hypothetical protein